MIVYPEEMQIAAHNIKWLRTQKHLAKAAMAKLLSISPTSLQKIEKGEFPARLRVVVPFRSSTHFNVSPADLFSKRLG